MTDGCDVEVYANLGTRLGNELRVRELDSPEGTVLYYERVVAKVQRRFVVELFSSLFTLDVHSFLGIIFFNALHYVQNHKNSY